MTVFKGAGCTRILRNNVFGVLKSNFFVSKRKMSEFYHTVEIFSLNTKLSKIFARKDRYLCQISSIFEEQDRNSPSIQPTHMK